MYRRSLLKAVIAVAATTAFACSNDPESAGSPNDTNPPTGGDGGLPPDGSDTDGGAKPDLDAPGDLDVFPSGVASGDPRSTSVVLWTRVQPPAGVSGDVKVTVQVSTDADFRTAVLDQEMTALAAHDYALKVKVTALSPRTTYYYRFSFRGTDSTKVSGLGRTRTAPDAGVDVPVRFAFASCQDYIGRYFNAWQHLVESEADLDFVVFLGDYIYETTGDASFQNANSPRKVTFTDPSSAISVGSGETQYYAAKSISNYRDIYRTVRNDRIIQRLHARYPFVVMWDDHEFSDDSWGDVGTYFDGVASEKDTTRKQNAEQVFYEYQPVDPRDAQAGAVDVDAEARFPNTHLYRDLSFGKNLKLVLTDYRSFRPDHLIPEDAYPGAVALDTNVLTLIGAAPAFTSDTFAYVNFDEPAYATQLTVLRGAYVQMLKAADPTVSDGAAATRAAAVVKGNLALLYVNQVLNAVNAALVVSPTDKPRGLAFVHMGKQSPFTDMGARYVVVKDAFDLYAKVLYAQSQGASENVYGTTQEAWIKESLQTAEPWKIFVSSVSLTSMMWDLRDKGLTGAELLYAQRFYVNVDQYDGFQNKKAELLKYIVDNAAKVQNALFVSGDIHASFASVESGVPCLTTPGISSFAFKTGIAAAVGAVVGTDGNVYRYAVTEMEQTFKDANKGMVFADASSHGYVTVEIKSATEAEATFHLLAAEEVETDYSTRPGELAAKATEKRFRVQGNAITAI